MADISSRDLQTVQRILADHIAHAEVRAFGSRVRGDAKPTSDFDLAIVSDGPLSLSVLGQLKEAFEKSDLSFRVDIVDWRETSEKFKALISERYEVIHDSLNEGVVTKIDRG